MPLFFLALMPSLVVLYYYYNRDRHPEPWAWVAVVVMLGSVSALIALPLEWGAFALRSTPPVTRAGLFLECLLVPGLIEESVKLLVVVAAVFWRSDFDEPIDGLIYGTAAALGFTFAEDWRYYLLHGPDWTRAISSVAHPWFSCFWGYALGRAKFAPWKRGIALVLVGLACSAAVHGTYDFLILAADVNQDWAWLRHLLVPLMIFLYAVMEHRLDAQRRPAKAGL